MKKKIALLLAVVMTVATPMSLFAAKLESSSSTSREIAKKTLFTYDYTGKPVKVTGIDDVDFIAEEKIVELNFDGDGYLEEKVSEIKFLLENAYPAFVRNGTGYGGAYSYDNSRWGNVTTTRDGKLGNGAFYTFEKAASTVNAPLTYTAKVTDAIVADDGATPPVVAKATEVTFNGPGLTDKVVTGAALDAVLDWLTIGDVVDASADVIIPVSGTTGPVMDFDEVTRDGNNARITARVNIRAVLNYGTLDVATGNVSKDRDAASAIDAMLSDGLEKTAEKEFIKAADTGGYLYLTGAELGTLKFDLPFITNGTGDVDLIVQSAENGLRVFGNKNVTFAKVPEDSGSTKARIKGTETSRSKITIEDFTIEENAIGVINGGGSIFSLTLTNGYRFAKFGAVDFDRYPNKGAGLIDIIGYSKDRNTVYFQMPKALNNDFVNKIVMKSFEVERIYGTNYPQTENVYVQIRNLDEDEKVYVYDIDGVAETNPSSYTCKVEADITEEKVLIGDFRDYGVFLGFKNSTDKVATPYGGEANVVIPNILFRENTGDSWNSNRTTRFSLTDEAGNLLNDVKIASIRFLMNDNLKWNHASTRFEEDKQIGSDNQYTFNRSFFELRDLKEQKDIDPSELEIELKINVSGNYSGPVFLTVDGNAIVDETEVETNPFKIAEVAAPIKVTSESTEASIGFQTFETADVTVEEADKNILKFGKQLVLSLSEFADSSSYYAIDSTITFNPITKDNVSVAEVDSTNRNHRAFEFNKYGVNHNVVYMGVSKASTVASTVTVSGLKVNINRSVPYGNIDLVVGGDAFVNTFYGWKTNVNTTDIEKSAFFPVAGVVFKDYVKVITKSVYKSMEKNVLITEDNQIAQVEGKEIDMGIPAYINDAGRMMLPLRAVSELFDIDKDNILWDEATSTVTIVLHERIVSFTKDSSIMKIDGVDVPMIDSAGTTVAEIHPVYERFFIPMKHLGTAFGVEAKWDAASKTAYMNPTPTQLKEVFGVDPDATANE